MPDSDLPRFPLDDAPSSNAGEDELPTVPHSLAPLSGSNGDESEPESPWGEVWRRRWLVAGVALMAFLAALAFGRVHSARTADVPRPTLSGASPPAASQATESESPPASELAVRETPHETATPVATSEELEMPPVEVPPAKGSAKARPRKAEAPAGTAPRKRFMPGAI